MIETLRQSSLRAWLTCPAEFYEKYILGLADEFNPVLELGTHYHSEVESYHLGRPYDDKLIGVYTEVIKPEPGELVEHSFEFTPLHPIFETALDIPFTGTIDLAIPGKRLQDLKTSSTSWSQTKADKAMPDLSGWYPELSGVQATAYLSYWHQEHGELLPFDFAVIRKDIRKNGQPYPLKLIRTERTLSDFARFHDLCQKVISDIRRERDFTCICRDQKHKLVLA